MTIRHPKGPWGTRPAEALLDAHMDQDMAEGIVDLYIERHAQECLRICANQDDSDNSVAHTILGQGLRAELPFAPLYENANGYQSIILGKVLPDTGYYLPGSVVSLGLKGPEDEQWLVDVTERQVRILLDQVVDLDDAGLRPGQFTSY